MDTTAVMTVGAVNTLIQATVAGSGIGLGNSTGTLGGLLEVLAGAYYALPAESPIDLDGATYNTTILGTMSNFRHTYATSSLLLSLENGVLSLMHTDAFLYNGVETQAIIVYADDGNYFA
jgi:hypothetical protein